MLARRCSSSPSILRVDDGVEALQDFVGLGVLSATLAEHAAVA